VIPADRRLELRKLALLGAVPGTSLVEVLDEVERLQALHDACACMDEWRHTRGVAAVIGTARFVDANGSRDTWHAETGRGVGSSALFNSSLASLIVGFAEAVKEKL
jgi:hypothetical protein